MKPDKPPVHDHTPEEERRIRDAALDETIEDTFPASDPPSSLPNPDDHDALERQTPPPGDHSAQHPAPAPSTKHSAPST